MYLEYFQNQAFQLFNCLMPDFGGSPWVYITQSPFSGLGPGLGLGLVLGLGLGLGQGPFQRA